MVHGGRARPRRATDRLRAKGPAIAKNKSANSNEQKVKHHKPVSLKNRIRSAERLLRKDLPPKTKEVQEKRLEELKNQLELQNRLAIERKNSLRYRKIKFFERRKIDRMIRRLEKQHTSADHNSESTTCEQLARLKEDLEYVRFFPKTEKYVALFVGENTAEIAEKREKLRKQIKDNLAAAAARGKDVEETASDDNERQDVSEDDFFTHGSSSDDVDADDEWTDKSARDPRSSVPGKATSGMPSDEWNKKHVADRARIPTLLRQNSLKPVHDLPRVPAKDQNTRKISEYLAYRNSSYNRIGPQSRHMVSSSAGADQSNNFSSNSDARKPHRKRRPKKKKLAQD